jgi:hypothetical protein
MAFPPEPTDPFALPPDPMMEEEEVAADPWAWVPGAWQQADPFGLPDAAETAAQQAAEDEAIRALIGEQPVIAEPEPEVVPVPVPVPEEPTPGPEATLPYATGAFSGAFAPEIPRDPRIAVRPEGTGLEAPTAPDLTEPLPEMTPAEEADFLEAQGPEYQITQQVLAEEEAKTAAAEAELESIRQDRARMVENQQSYERAMQAAQQESAELIAEAKQLANRTADKDRWWSSRTPGQKVAGYLSVAMSSMSNWKLGAPNEALERIDREIERDVQLQIDDLTRMGAGLERRRGLVGDMYARSGDALRAGEQARIAMRQSVDNELAAQQMLYDPQGTQARRIVALRQGWRAKQAAAEAAADERAWKRYEFQYKTDLAAQKAASEAQAKELDRLQRDRASRRTADLGYAKLRSAEEDRKLRREEAQRARTREEGKVETKEVRELSVPGLAPGAGGKPHKFADRQVAEEITKQGAAAEQINGIVERVISARDKYGWSNDLLKSDEWRQAKADYAFITGLAGQEYFDLGALSGDDLELTRNMFGTQDVTELQDPTEGLKRAQKNFKEGYRQRLKWRGYPGWETWEPETPIDVRAEQREATEDAAEAETVSRYGGTAAELQRDYNDMVELRRRDDPTAEVPSYPAWVESRAVELAIPGGPPAGSAEDIAQSFEEWKAAQGG